MTLSAYHFQKKLQLTFLMGYWQLSYSLNAPTAWTLPVSLCVGVLVSSTFHASGLFRVIYLARTIAAAMTRTK